MHCRFCGIKAYTRERHLQQCDQSMGRRRCRRPPAVDLLHQAQDLETCFRRHILIKGPALATVKQTCGRSFFGGSLEELRKLGYEEEREWPFNVDRSKLRHTNTFISKVLRRSPTPARDPEEGRCLQGPQVTVSNARAQVFRMSVTPTSWIRAWW